MKINVGNPGALPDGSFQDKDVTQGIPGAKVMAEILNSIMWEQYNVLLAAGLTPDDTTEKTTAVQLGKAVQILGAPIGTIYFNCIDGYTPPLCIPASGQELLRVDYPELWGAVELTAVTEASWSGGMQGAFSTGDGATTFRVPLLDGEFLRALDRGAGVDAGRVHGSMQTDEIQAHNHTIWAYSGVSGTPGSSGGLVRNGPSGSTEIPEAIVDAGGAETRPRNVACPVWIKYA